MATRRIAWSLVALVAMTAAADAATVRTTNFIVETARQDDAEEFGRLAEHYRKQKAIEWLGKEMPAWRQPCRLRVYVTGNGAGGATTFDFDGPVIQQSMQIEGARERLKNSVLPHAVTHTVFAYHFRQPGPRWADEGGSVYSEDDIERARHDKLCKTILNDGRGIQLKALFRLKEYPRDVMTLYAQGYSVTKYLVELQDRPTFLNFVATGMQQGWDAACQEYYGIRNVEELEHNWIEHLKAVAAHGETAVASGRSRPAPPGADSKLVVFDSSPPSRPSFDPAPDARGLAPSGSDRDRFGGDIGWNRPRARLADPVPADDLPRPGTRTSGTSSGRPYTPSAVLLPPEPAPER